MVHHERPYVPYNVIERIVRMSLERGRLPALMFDMSQSRSHRFMNKVMESLMKLPGAERLTASEQVHSRFVRYALSQIPDPTGD